MPSLNALRAFEAAARHRSFAKAADELGVTATAISHQIRLLEATMDAGLFRRQPRPMVLTAAGAALFPTVQDCFDRLAQAVEDLKAGPDGRLLRITTTSAFASGLLLPHLGSWAKRQPAIDLEVHASDTPVDLVAENIDAAIRYARAPSGGMSWQELCADRYRPMLSPSLAANDGRTALPPEELLRLPLITYRWKRADPAQPTWEAWHGRAARADAHLPPLSGSRMVRFSEESHAIEAALAGQGVVLASAVITRRHRSARRLVVGSRLSLPGLTYSLVTPAPRIAGRAAARPDRVAAARGREPAAVRARRIGRAREHRLRVTLRNSLLPSKPSLASIRRRSAIAERGFGNRSGRRGVQAKQVATLLATAAMSTTLVASAFAASGRITFWQDDSRYVPVTVAALYPEGIEYHPSTGEFLLGSIRQGKVIAVSPEGAVRTLVEDERLRSVVGIRVDAARGRLLVNNSDYGVAERSEPSDKFATVALGIYDLETGVPIQYVPLGGLRPGESRFANDLTVDADGNAYVTDSLAAAIYKVTPAGEASVFLTHERFRGEGFNLNGIQAHPDGYLLVAKKSDGSLFKVPLADPSSFSEVALPPPLIGTDGLLLSGPDQLVAITNLASGVESNTVFKLVSDDGWQTARIEASFATGAVYPTTGTVGKDRIFVSYGRLDTLPATVRDGGEMIESFRIQEIGKL